MQTLAVRNDLFGQPAHTRPPSSLLKWVGNKYRVAEEITPPAEAGTYYEVFFEVRTTRCLRSGL